VARLKRLYIEASPLTEEKFSGIPHFTAELTRAIDCHPDNGKSFELVLVVAFDKKTRLQKLGYKNAKIKTIPLPMRIFNLFWKYNLLPPLDIFLGKGTYLFPNYKNWKLVRSASMTYIHDLGFMRYPESVQPKNLDFLNKNIHKWIDRSDIVLTGSEHARKEIIKLLNVSPNKITSIYHGVDHSEYFPKEPADIALAKKKYNIRGDYILYLGSIEPRKNLKRLINSYKMLPKSLRDKYALCLVGGGGWLNEDIIEAIDQSKKDGFNIVQPNKYVEEQDLPSIISGAILLAHPALYEGFGLSPLQAMACGTPVVVANNSSLTEVVGKAGGLVDAENEADISAKMEKVLTDRKYRSSMIASGLEQAQKFNWGISAQELLKCMNKLGHK